MTAKRALTGHRACKAIVVLALTIFVLPVTALPQVKGRAAAPLLDPQTGRPIIQNVIRYLDDLFRSDSSIARLSLVVTRPRRTQTLEMKVWTRGTEKALVVIEKPERDAGTATLKVGDNLWNYLPRIARTIRIPPSMMLSSWMGSDFTNDDLVRESSLLKDFDATLKGRSEEPKGWLVELTAKEGVVGLWQRIEYIITPDASLPVQAQYFDRKGRLARTLTFEDVREFSGRRIPSHMVLTPTDKKGQKTEMFYKEIVFDVNVPEDTFSLSRLEQNR